MDYKEKIGEILENASQQELERAYWFLMGYIGEKKETGGCGQEVNCPKGAREASLGCPPLR